MRTKTVLITGASGKLGQNITSNLYKQKYNIIGVCRSKEKIKELEARYKGVDYYSCDFKNDLDVNILCDKLLSKYSNIDIIINNAAVDINKPFLETQLNEFTELFKINLFAPYMLLKRIIPSMIDNNGGTILNISSNLSVRTIPHATEYSLSKAALCSLTRSIAVEFGKYNINSICINITGMRGKLNDVNDTSDNLLSAIDDDYSDWKVNIEKIPSRRCATFQEFSEIINFFISDKAKFINGECIFVDGGVNSLQ